MFTLYQNYIMNYKLKSNQHKKVYNIKKNIKEKD